MTLDGMALPSLAKSDTLADRIATEILKALAARRQSQAALARAMEVPAMWVSDRLSGKTQLTVNDLERVAAALGIKAVDLLPQQEREATVTSRQPSTSVHMPVNIRPPDGRPGSRPRGGRPPNSPNRTSRLNRAA